MDGEWYDINYQDGLGLLYLAGVTLLVAIIVQILSRRLKWYPPIIVGLVAFAPAVIELVRWGSGDCGIVFFSRAQFSVFATALFLAYESFQLHQHRRTTGLD